MKTDPSADLAAAIQKSVDRSPENVVEILQRLHLLGFSTHELATAAGVAFATMRLATEFSSVPRQQRALNAMTDFALANCRVIGRSDDLKPNAP
jgi:hypothetical protein